MTYLSYLARKKQLLIIFIVVGGFVFYDHSFKIHQSSRIAPKESSTSILPFRNLTGDFLGVIDYYINYATAALKRTQIPLLLN